MGYLVSVVVEPAFRLAEYAARLVGRYQVFLRQSLFAAELVILPCERLAYVLTFLCCHGSVVYEFVDEVHLAFACDFRCDSGVHHAVVAAAHAFL